MAKRKGLGRGLDALLGGTGSAAALGRGDGANRAGELHQLPVDMIQRGRYQPRLRMDDETLASLAASIRERGVLQPIVVRPIAGGGFEILAGCLLWSPSVWPDLNTL